MPFSKHLLEKFCTKAGQANTVIESTKRNRINHNLYYLVASCLFLIFALASCNGDSGTDITTIEPPGVRYEIARYSQHLTEPTPVSYTDLGHWPPTSGHHWPRWAKCGFYETELPDELVVHNMEHGNIVVSYNLVSQKDIESLKESFSDVSLSKLWGVARFYSKIPEGQISLSTWGVTDSFTDVDTSRIRRFFEAYHGVLGPERVPCDDHPK